MVALRYTTSQAFTYGWSTAKNLIADDATALHLLPACTQQAALDG